MTMFFAREINFAFTFEKSHETVEEKRTLYHYREQKAGKSFGATFTWNLELGAEGSAFCQNIRRYVFSGSLTSEATSRISLSFSRYVVTVAVCRDQAIYLLRLFKFAPRLAHKARSECITLIF